MRADGDALVEIARLGIVPVVELDSVAHAEALGHALVSANLPCVEVSLRTPAALDCIRALVRIDDLLVGAGTVTQVEQVEQVADAGARFTMAPGLSSVVARACGRRGLTHIPGVATATEIQAARALGFDVVKVFPAGALGGVPMLTALAAPFPGIRFLPSGGVTADTLADYLAVREVIAVGGTWLARRAVIASGDMSRIIATVRAAVPVVDAARGRVAG